MRGPLVTEGRVVVFTERDRPGSIAAYGLDDGELRWRTGLVIDLYLVASTDHLYGWSERGLVALG